MPSIANTNNFISDKHTIVNNNNVVFDNIAKIKFPTMVAEFFHLMQGTMQQSLNDLLAKVELP